MPSKLQTCAITLMLALAGSADATEAPGLRGPPDAVAAARQLLEGAGGADAWRRPIFTVRERGYTAGGKVAELTITRDLARPARLLRSTTSERTVVEWISPETGWTRRDAQATAMSAEELAQELQGLRQEPYAIYHRIAVEDPALRVDLREDGTLRFYDAEERLLCWFQRAPNGVLLGWGNVYDGAVTQHWYGPAADLGDAILPRFGASSTGSFRFEYLGATLADGSISEPE